MLLLVAVNEHSWELLDDWAVLVNDEEHVMEDDEEEVDDSEIEHTSLFSVFTMLIPLSLELFEYSSSWLHGTVVWSRWEFREGLRPRDKSSNLLSFDKNFWLGDWRRFNWFFKFSFSENK